jgi:hypothetical protein
LRIDGIGWLAGTLLLVGCATAAPPLPPDTTSINRTRTETIESFSEADRALSCEQIAAEQNAIRDRLAADNRKIEDNRTRNVVAGALGVAVVPLLPALATVSNSEEKDDIAAQYRRKDVLIKLAAVKTCP